MATMELDREKSLQEYRKKLLEHKEVESRLKESRYVPFTEKTELIFLCYSERATERLNKAI